MLQDTLAALLVEREADDALHDIVRSVQENGGCGELTLTVRVEHIDGADERVYVTAEVAKRVGMDATGLLYVDGSGMLRAMCGVGEGDA